MNHWNLLKDPFLLHHLTSILPSHSPETPDQISPLYCEQLDMVLCTVFHWLLISNEKWRRHKRHKDKLKLESHISLPESWFPWERVQSSVTRNVSLLLGGGKQLCSHLCLQIEGFWSFTGVSRFHTYRDLISHLHLTQGQTCGRYLHSAGLQRQWGQIPAN